MLFLSLGNTFFLTVKFDIIKLFHSLVQIKCHNVIILNATNVTELDEQWDCLIKLTKSQGLLELAEPFVSKCLETTLFDVSYSKNVLYLVKFLVSFMNQCLVFI